MISTSRSRPAKGSRSVGPTGRERRQSSAASRARSRRPLVRSAFLGYPAGSRDARRVVGVSLSQERSFYLRLSGEDNLLFAAGVRGIDRREAARRVTQLTEELELGAILAKRVDRCSTGMVQQLAFARALIGEPDLLLLDEPTKSLDTAATERLWQAVSARPEVALVIATHREDDVARCRHRLDLSSR